MTTITVQLPARAVEAPRLTVFIATLFLQPLAWLQRSSAERAERRAVAERLAEAAAVRDYAQRFARHDPRFVADLLAAADRHERGG